jgi:hypothetical protein
LSGADPATWQNLPDWKLFLLRKRHKRDFMAG